MNHLTTHSGIKLKKTVSETLSTAVTLGELLYRSYPFPKMRVNELD